MNALKQINEQFPLSAQELADRTGLHDSRIRQLAPDMESKGLCVKIGKVWQFTAEAAKWIDARPDNRFTKKGE